MGRDAAQRVFDAIDPAKDVDGFIPINVGRLVQGRAASRAVHAVRRHRDARSLRHRDRRRPRGRHRPQRHRRQADGAAAAAPRRHGDDLPLEDAAICRGGAEADILVAAIGRPGFVTREFVKPGATVIDVGINRVTDARDCRGAASARARRGSPDFERRGSVVVGDVHPAVAEVAGALTPVPGGVGPLTIAMLLKNTVTAARSRAALTWCRAALTGGIATGKSYCLARFAALGVPTIDADKLARARGRSRVARARRGRRALRPGILRDGRHARSRRRWRASSSPTASPAPTSRRSSTPTSTAASATGSRSCRSTTPRRRRRHPAAVRDRPRARLRRGDRRRLQPEEQLRRLMARDGLTRGRRARAPGRAVADRREGPPRALRDPDRRRLRRDRRRDRSGVYEQAAASAERSVSVSVASVSLAGAIRSSTNVFHSWQCGHCQSSSVLR